MLNKILAGGLFVAGSVALAVCASKIVKAICKRDDYITEGEKFVAETRGYLKGYLAGNKEFAEYVKEHDPELYKKIEAM